MWPNTDTRTLSDKSEATHMQHYGGESGRVDLSDQQSVGSPSRQKLGPWRPLKRLTRYEMNHMRSLKEVQPEEWTVGKLARKFGVSSGAVKRILRSKFDPSEEVKERQEKRVQELRVRRKEILLRNIHNTKHEHSD